MYGPVYRTFVYNNTVYYTGAASQGLICGAGCSSNIMTAKNNIVWAEQKAAFADAQFTESNNIYWSSNGQPFVQFMNFSLNAADKITNPLFVNPGAQDFQLQSTSTAIDTGVNLGWAKDLLGTALPQGTVPDIGAYEFK